MKKTIFIAEDDDLIIELYKSVLENDYELAIFDKVFEAVEYVASDNFKDVSLAILDLNIESGIKIGGFNIAYKIFKKSPTTPIIICSSILDDTEVKKYTKTVKASYLKKPVDVRELKELVNDLVAEKYIDKMHDIEICTREFITASIYLKQLLKFDLMLPEEYESVLNDLEKVEESILADINDLKGESKTLSFKVLKTDIEYYVNNLTDIGKSIIYTGSDKADNSLIIVQEMFETGNKLLELLKNY
jgi:DNA-binding NarL/FixJ family response regulator